MLIESFLDYLQYERNYSEKTVLAYGEDIKQLQEFAQEEYGKFNPLEVEAELIREWIVSLMDKGYTSTSVNRKLSSLRTFYKYLLRQGETTIDPLRKVKGPKNKKPLPVFLKENEMNRLLDETDFGEGFKGCRDRLIIEMFYATGMRLSELIGLDNKDVDFSASLLKVTGKRNKQRLIPFGDELQELMLEYINVRNETIPERSEAFFIRENGERLYKNLVYNLVKRNLSKVATLKKKSPHVLRHTFATTMLNNEAELGAVKELLGHESITTTEIYTHATFEELKKVYICGDLQITIYYFLRDASLKFDGLKASEAKAVLDTFCGVKIYRDGFRVRPYGEEGNDWLLLDKIKISDPHGYRVGNNQVIGVVNINSDANPLLIDSTNREAIIENEAFAQLKQVVNKCINIIENHRYTQYLEERKQTKIAEEEEKRKQERGELTKTISQTKEKFSKALKNGNIDKAEKAVSEILETVSRDQKKEQKHFENTKKEYEKKLRDSNNELRLYKNLAALGILAGSFGHETDDAIARILLNIVYPRERLIMEFPDDNDIKASFNDLDNDIQRISCYSDLLMAFLKKNKRSEVKKLSFKNVIETIVKYYKILVDEYNISIDISNLQEFSCEIFMKQIDLESIIVNMLTNSFEALKGTGGKRVIKISTIDFGEEYQIVFEDSGPGVPDNLKEWIFIPLNTTKEEDGVGLGLTIVKDIVESYNGKIEVGKSNAIGGAQFTVIFPVDEVKDE